MIQCDYPECIKEHKVNHTIKLSNENDANVMLPFCWYHYYVVCGGHFTAIKLPTKKGEPSTFRLEGPIKEVTLIEQVNAAILVTKNIRKNELKKLKEEKGE